MDIAKLDTAPRLCNACHGRFPGWEALLKHKAQKRAAGEGHVHCKFCGQDFVTLVAETLHIHQHHPEKQNLECPGCGHGPFIRLGGLMSHIEHGECARLNPRVLEELRAEKLDFAKKLQEVTNEPIKNNYTSFVSPEPDACTLVSGQTRKVAEPFNLKSRDFPTLGGGPVDSSAEWNYDRSPAHEFENPWGPLEDEETSSVTPLMTQRLGNQLQPTLFNQNVQTISEDLDIHHPSHPSFNPARYFCEYAQKFVCPKIGCPKTFKKKSGVIAHLKMSHGPFTWRCPTCFRRFKSLTSITMHVESNGTRCRIRDTQNYDAYLDQLTAGLVDVNISRHEDGTVAYRTAPGAKELFQERTKNAEVDWVATEGSKKSRGIDKQDNAGLENTALW